MLQTSVPGKTGKRGVRMETASVSKTQCFGENKGG